MPKSETIQVGDRYLALVRRFPLRRIRSDAELDRAIAIIDELVGPRELSPEERDYLDILSDQVERYEEEAHPIPPATPAAMLRYLMEARELAQARLAADTGIPVSTISEVLSGKRGLSKANIVALSRYFKVKPGVFLPE